MRKIPKEAGQDLRKEPSTLRIALCITLLILLSVAAMAAYNTALGEIINHQDDARYSTDP